ncbi:gamma-glutamylcyclotransferase [Robertmurraya andreesenii]|uniref:Gamma-glutamylcyclotransferase family protein n=1 Tax=Anoxybacillus andreesenii TaxID=1325932 RepID=A0ABT9V6U4_9BACL|nr:gamma-glutamylcyclotransferase [Robertmurraya andreesenii]MDQ0156669.1 gamma-glutamylcyclotransferase (GGCT)/AIG2-like uncharacterized protein YtfP [Robertmurraya andreesenii]
MKVFVYGTLRKHEKNHDKLKAARVLAEQAWVYGELFDTGLGYPVMRKSNEKKVYGELYEIDDEILKELDWLEGYEPENEDHLYERMEVEVYTDFNRTRAITYVENRAIAKEAISSGDWKLHQLMKSKPNKLYYFAYGSCMDVERFQKANVDHFFQAVVGACRLDGYSMKYLFSVADGGRADIIEDGGVVEGILYEVPLEAVEYLFEREGFYTGWYRATFVDVTVDEQEYNDVLTFHVYDKKAEQAPPAHYAEEILRGSKGRVSEAYYNKLVAELKRLGCEFVG